MEQGAKSRTGNILVAAISAETRRPSMGALSHSSYSANIHPINATQRRLLISVGTRIEIGTIPTVEGFGVFGATRKERSVASLRCTFEQVSQTSESCEAGRQLGITASLPLDEATWKSSIFSVSRNLIIWQGENRWLTVQQVQR